MFDTLGWLQKQECLPNFTEGRHGLYYGGSNRESGNPSCGLNNRCVACTDKRHWCRIHILKFARAGVQELYRWPKVAEAGRNALKLRYQLMPYLYTTFRHTAGHGCPLARPLFFGWPADSNARDIDWQWLMGDSILITPALHDVRSTHMFPFSILSLVVYSTS